jgi:hypothetical protein
MIDNRDPESLEAPLPAPRFLFLKWALVGVGLSTLLSFMPIPLAKTFSYMSLLDSTGRHRLRASTDLNVLFLNDIHYDPDYVAQGTPADGCIVVNPSPNATYNYGQYGCDSPKFLLASLFTSAPKLTGPLDYIFFGGDVPPHRKGFTRPDVLALYETVNQMFTSAYPSVPVYRVLGNHDFVPTWGNYSTDPLDFQNNLNVFTGLTDSEKATFLQGGYYFHDFDNLRILFLNSVMYSTSRKNTSGPDPWGQFAWIDSVCSDARSKGMVIGSFMHIPPGVQKVGSKAGWYSQYIDTFHQLVVKYDIQFNLNGHSHEDQILRTQKSDNPRFFLSSPSVSPVDGNNPGFRVYQIGQTGISNYQQYYTDILTNPTTLSWQLEYDFKAAYNATDLSPQSVQKAVMWLRNDPEGRWRYRERMYARAIQDGGFYYCQMTAATREDVLECQKKLSQDIKED